MDYDENLPIYSQIITIIYGIRWIKLLSKTRYWKKIRMVYNKRYEKRKRIQAFLCWYIEKIIKDENIKKFKIKWKTKQEKKANKK